MIQWRHDCPDTHELVAFAVGYQIELGDGARSFVHELATELPEWKIPRIPHPLPATA